MENAAHRYETNKSGCTLAAAASLLHPVTIPLKNVEKWECTTTSAPWCSLKGGGRQANTTGGTLDGRKKNESHLGTLINHMLWHPINTPEGNNNKRELEGDSKIDLATKAVDLTLVYFKAPALLWVEVAGDRIDSRTHSVCKHLFVWRMYRECIHSSWEETVCV